MGNLAKISRSDKIILGLAGLICAIVLVALASRGVFAFRLDAVASNLGIYFSCVIAYLIYRISRIIILDRPELLTQAIIEKEFTAEKRKSFMRALPVMLAMALFMPVFSTIKSNIELFNQYSWDLDFVALDRAIHGTEPWRLLQPILGYPIISAILAFLYQVWLLLIYAGGTFFAFYHRNQILRQRYFTAYFLIWSVNGMLLAIMLASVGPCFLEPLFGRTDYMELTAYLNEANRQYPVAVVDIQQMLLDWHFKNDQGLGRGITAMPSMHVSMAFLFYLAMRHVTPMAGKIFGAFFLIILVSSVHLGFHYAVDGYLSIITTSIIWKVCGYVATRTAEQPAIYNQAMPDAALAGNGGMVLAKSAGA